MKLLSVFRSKGIRKLWEYSCEGVLWRMLFSPNGCIVGESRDPEAKKTSFFCLEESSGRILWRDRQFAEPWWIGIEEVSGSTVILHSFVKPDMPQHRGVTVLDLRSGAMLWEHPHETFVCADRNLIFTVREDFEERRFFAIDGRSGEIDTDLGTDVSRIQEIRRSKRDEDAFRGFSYPESYADADTYTHAHGHLPEWLFRRETVSGPIDVVESGSCRVISWYELSSVKFKQSGILSQQIAILSSESGKILYRDMIAENLALPGQDSFFLKDSILYYIKNLNVLTAIDLPEPHGGR